MLTAFKSNVGSYVARVVAKTKKAATVVRLQYRLWVSLIALAAIALGGYMVIGPASVFASGRTLGFKAVLTLTWLITGAAMVAGGVGILLRMPSHRKYCQASFICSIPLPLAYGYKTVTRAFEMRAATGNLRADLEPWVWGGVRLSLFFAAVSGFLYLLLHYKPLQSMPCPGGGRAGMVAGGAINAVLGAGVGYLTWMLCRWLGVTMGIQFFRDAIRMVWIDHFVMVGAVLGALPTLFRAKSGRVTQKKTGPSAVSPSGSKRARRTP